MLRDRDVDEWMNAWADMVAFWFMQESNGFGVCSDVGVHGEVSETSRLVRLCAAALCQSRVYS